MSDPSSGMSNKPPVETERTAVGAPLTLRAAFDACMEKFGYIVIGLYPEALPIGVGARVTGIWGTHKPPRPVWVHATAKRPEWIRQNRYLISLGGAFPEFALRPGYGARFYRVTPDAPSAPLPEGARPKLEKP